MLERCSSYTGFFSFDMRWTRIIGSCEVFSTIIKKSLYRNNNSGEKNPKQHIKKDFNSSVINVYCIISQTIHFSKSN